MTSKTATTLRHDPCCSATKNFRNMTAASGPFIEFSLVGTNKFTSEQASVKAFSAGTEHPRVLPSSMRITIPLLRFPSIL